MSRAGERGTTFAEVMATAAILMILASAILPLARVTAKRQREAELRRALREMRTAIDRYKLAVDQGQIGGSDVRLGSEGYPPALETLVKGVNQVGRLDHKLKFLRRIPRDPLTGEAEWGKRSSKQDPDDEMWDSQNLYDVYSLAEGKALDGTEYKTW